MQKSLTVGTQIKAISGDTFITGSVNKLNRKTAVVVVNGGTSKFQNGTKVKVPYGLIREPFVCVDYGREGSELSSLPSKGDAPESMPSEYWVYQNIHALMILNGIYASLSPENLTGDGELTRTEVDRRWRQLNKEKIAVETLMGRTVSETTLYRILGEYADKISEALEEDAEFIKGQASLNKTLGAEINP